MSIYFPLLSKTFRYSFHLPITRKPSKASLYLFLGLPSFGRLRVRPRTNKNMFCALFLPNQSFYSNSVAVLLYTLVFIFNAAVSLSREIRNKGLYRLGTFYKLLYCHVQTTIVQIYTILKVANTSHTEMAWILMSITCTREKWRNVIAVNTKVQTTVLITLSRLVTSTVSFIFYL